MVAGSNAVDYGALRSLLEWHVECGTAGVVALGTTGEASTLSGEERDRCCARPSTSAAASCPSSPAPRDRPRSAIAMGRPPAELGADGTLVVTPYYVKPPQCGDDFLLYSGEDAMGREFVALGGDGVISVTANVAPRDMQTMLANPDKSGSIKIDAKPGPPRAIRPGEPDPRQWALHRQPAVAGIGAARALELVPRDIDDAPGSPA
ncbi:4-hydroxy-tetrahydrodipicolinate synthase [Aureococcus anophagefferens]|nr:4-hydroxy-tetrahydrodipicolinate synthase [Aureococcus anophagefferens]